MREKWRWRIRAIFHSPRITAFTASPAPSFRGLVNKQNQGFRNPSPLKRSPVCRVPCVVPCPIGLGVLIFHGIHGTVSQ